MRWVLAAASIALALSETLVEFAVPVGILEFVGLVLSVPSVYLCLPGGRPPEEGLLWIHFLLISEAKLSG